MKPKISYDRESRILSIKFGKQRSVDSAARSNVVVDFGKNHEIVGIEIMDFSLDEFSAKGFRLPGVMQRAKSRV